MIQSFAVGPVRRGKMSAWWRGEGNKLNILFIYFFPVIDPTLTLQSNTNKAKRKSDRERKKKNNLSP